MQNKKIFATFAILMLALGVAGFAYAHWEKIITIDGTVDTGILDWQFRAASGKDIGITEEDWHCREGFVGPPPVYWQGDKHVGRTFVKIETPHLVNITLDNVYPSYFTSVSVYAENIGTIPLIIDSIIINGHVLRKSPTLIIRLDLNDDVVADIEIWWGDGFGVQLHPGEWSPEMSFWVHVLQGAPQGETLSFTIKLVAINWNEYVPP